MDLCSNAKALNPALQRKEFFFVVEDIPTKPDY